MSVLSVNFEMRSTLKIVIFHLLFCKCLGTYSENFEIKSENLNKRLVSYTILEKYVKRHHDCVRECFHFGGQCKAINYDLRSRTCELKSKGSGDVTDVSEYEHATGYIFTDITDWPALSLSECSKNNCLDNQNCFPHGNAASGCIDKVDCGTVSVLEFATVTAWATTEGAVATYSCDFGYEFSGTISQVTCNDGSWTAEGPIACIPKDCGQPAGVTYGSVYAPVTTHGATAIYKCDVEYEITSGNAVRTCTDGSWVGTIPVCTLIPNVGCYVAGQSTLYVGTRRTTINGRDCQRWDSQSPHSHTYTNPNMYPSGDISSNENYCRNPDPGYGLPWCYTTDSGVRWEDCGIPLC